VLRHQNLKKSFVVDDCFLCFGTMVSRAPTWTLFYKNLATNRDIDLKMDKIMEFNVASIPENVWISNLIKNPGLALLLVDGFGKLVLLHNLSYLHKSIFCDESKVLGLSGNSDQAEVFRIDPVSATKHVEFAVPTWRDMKGCQSEEAVNSLTVPDQNPILVKCKACLWIPPMVLTTILEENLYNPAALIPLLSTKFQEFDKSSTSTKACTILRPVIEYLWAVHKKLIPASLIAVDNSQDALEWSARQHFAYVFSPVPLPPPFPTPPVPNSQAMTDELRRIRDVAERQLLRDTQLGEAKKDSNGWDKLPDMVQNMILKLSAVQDDVLPVEPSESYIKILKQSKVLGVAMVINLELTLRKCQVEVPTSMANAIKTGNFRANSFMVAHSFSVFNVPYTDAANMSSCNKTELDILDEGEGIPKDIAKKLAENKFHYPHSTHLLRHQINNWYGVLQVCFGDKSLLAKESRAWIKHIDEFELAYDARFKTDSEFGAKILGAIDLSFFQFCDSCFRATSIHDVDFGKISLANLRDDIINNRFHENMPVYLVANKGKRDLDEEDAEEVAAKKKKRLKDIKDFDKNKNFKDLGEMVKNQHPVQEWLLPGGKYKALFTREVNVTTPAFNDSGLVTCNKWHIRGFCYERCDRKNSHKKFESGTHKTAYDTWVKALKAKLP